VPTANLDVQHVVRYSVNQLYKAVQHCRVDECRSFWMRCTRTSAANSETVTNLTTLQHRYVTLHSCTWGLPRPSSVLISHFISSHLTPFTSNKKLCYSRGTSWHARQYRKKLAVNEWPLHTPKVITVAAVKLWPYGISLPVCGLLFQRLYLGPFSRYYHFWSKRDCLWPWELLCFWQRSLNYKQR